MKQEYKYYIADPSGVTACALDAAEELGSHIQDRLAKLATFTRGKECELVMIGSNRQLPVPVFYIESGRAPDSDLIPLEDPLGLVQKSAWSTKLYIPACGKPREDICHSFELAVFELGALESFRKMEERIVKDAHCAKVPVKTSAALAEVRSPFDTTVCPRAYKVFTDWIYKVPVSAKGEHFIPPQSVEATLEQVNKLTVGMPLDAYKAEHRRVWNVLKKLRYISLD